MLSDGRSVKVDQAGFTLYRTLPDRSDRQKVMSAFFQGLGSFSRTFGTTMNGEVQKVLFQTNVRKYPSAVASSLDGPNIPVSVYTRLVDGVNRNLPTFHRYLKLRKRMMGLSELHYYDLYAPLVGSVKLEYTPEEAEKNVLAAVAPLGPAYGAVVQRAFNERWIDLFPTEGKRSGAYSDGGAYDVHPYMLINYNGKYDDMSTLAHELGHTMHSYYSNGRGLALWTTRPSGGGGVDVRRGALLDHVLDRSRTGHAPAVRQLSRASRAPSSGRRSRRVRAPDARGEG